MDASQRFCVAMLIAVMCSAGAISTVMFLLFIKHALLGVPEGVYDPTHDVFKVAVISGWVAYIAYEARIYITHGL